MLYRPSRRAAMIVVCGTNLELGCGFLPETEILEGSAHRAGRDAAGQGALEEQEEDDGRQDADQRRGTGRGGVHELLALQYREADRHGLLGVGDEEGEGQEKLVPGPDEEEREQYGQGGAADRDDNPPQGAPPARAVDLCGVEQFGGE